MDENINSSSAHITYTYATDDQHSSSSRKSTAGLLHIMGSNRVICAVLRGHMANVIVHKQ